MVLRHPDITLLCRRYFRSVLGWETLGGYASSRYEWCIEYNAVLYTSALIRVSHAFV